MRTNFLFIFLSFILFSLSGIAQTISNSGFENWSNVTHYEEPDQFLTSNPATYSFLNVPNVEKVTDAQSGSYAIKMETLDSDDGPVPGMAFIGMIGEESILGGIPFTERPDSVKGFAKYNVPAGDTAYVAVLLKKFGAPLGICFAQFTGSQNTYEAFSAPVEWLLPVISPDTMAVALTSSTIFVEPIPGSMLIVDNLSFVGASTPFPNGDFEVWNSLTSEEPDDWFTSNVFTLMAGGTSVTKTTDSHDGDYAIQIENTLTIWDDTLGLITNGNFLEDGPIGGMPVTQTPDVLSGYYKYMPVDEDTALAGVFLYHYNEALGYSELLEENFMYLLPTDVYLPFELQVEYTDIPLPDTVNIAFASGNTDELGASVGLGSTLIVDELSITYKPYSAIGEEKNPEIVKIFPNPASDQLFIKFIEFPGRNTTLNIMDSKGKVVLEKNIENHSNKILELNVSDFPAGIYFYRLHNNDFTHSGKFVVN
jgi:hypothetical protein